MKNEPAYPIPGTANGLTMRDWFAGMALIRGLTAQESYDLADDMLKQREIADNA